MSFTCHTHGCQSCTLVKSRCLGISIQRGHSHDALGQSIVLFIFHSVKWLGLLASSQVWMGVLFPLESSDNCAGHYRIPYPFLVMISKHCLFCFFFSILLPSTVISLPLVHIIRFRWPNWSFEARLAFSTCQCADRSSLGGQLQSFFTL